MDFGSHTPYVLTAYAVSIIVLAGLIGWRIIALKKAAAAATKDAKENL
jgi:heme exporter protein CcmD